MSEVPLALWPPDKPGTYRFEVLVEQPPGAPFETAGPGATPLTVTLD